MIFIDLSVTATLTNREIRIFRMLSIAFVIIMHVFSTILRWKVAIQAHPSIFDDELYARSYILSRVATSGLKHMLMIARILHIYRQLLFQSDICQWIFLPVHRIGSV